MRPKASQSPSLNRPALWLVAVMAGDLAGLALAAGLMGCGGPALHPAPEPAAILTPPPRARAPAMTGPRPAVHRPARTNLALAWGVEPTSLAGDLRIQLETRTNLAGPWRIVTNLPYSAATQTVSIAGPEGFYRLAWNWKKL